MSGSAGEPCQQLATEKPHKHLVPVLTALKQLSVICRPGWEASVAPSKPVQHYLLRLQAVARSQPHLLIGHSFAMHAALMAGGQLTKRMLTKHVKLELGKGTATFDYQARLYP